MGIRLFQTNGGDAAYDRWQDARDLHDEDGCPKCHKVHVLGHEVVLNALDYPDIYPCCVDEFEDMKEAGKVCAIHPKAYFEPAKNERAAYCEECPEVRS